MRLGCLVALIGVLLRGPAPLTNAAHVANAAEAEGPAKRVTVKRDRVPVYARTTTASLVVMQLMRGDVVKVEPAEKTAEGEWCKVRETAVWGRSGYVQCRDLKREEPPAEGPPKITARPEGTAPPLVPEPPAAPPLPVPEEPPPTPTATRPKPEVKREKRYTLQVASLVVERNALALKKRLEELGYTPVIRTVTAPITRHRVFGGEFDSREEAERTARRLKGDGFPSKLVKIAGGTFRLEVGSFFHLDQAIDLAHNLQQKNYTPKIDSTTAPTPVHAVRVGDYENRSEALAVLGALKRQGFTPLIVRR